MVVNRPRESSGVITCCGKIRSQVIGYCVLCTGGTFGAENDKTLITNLKLPQFTSEMEDYKGYSQAVSTSTKSDAHIHVHI